MLEKSRKNLSKVWNFMGGKNYDLWFSIHNKHGPLDARFTFMLIYGISKTLNFRNVFEMFKFVYLTLNVKIGWKYALYIHVGEMLIHLICK